MSARRIPGWQTILFAGVVLTVFLSSVGFAVQRLSVDIPDRGGLPYVTQPPTPFEREVTLETDHSVVLSEGDQDIWYFGAAATLALTLGSVPLLRSREAAEAG